MRYHRCKCGHKEVMESGMPPPACDPCEKCGTVPASSPSLHPDVEGHQLNMEMSVKDGETVQIWRCLRCFKTFDRCTFTCPHGDRCRLPENHDGGHNHRCDCNEPDEKTPPEWNIPKLLVNAAEQQFKELNYSSFAEALGDIMGSLVFVVDAYLYNKYKEEKLPTDDPAFLKNVLYHLVGFYGGRVEKQLKTVLEEKKNV